MQVQNINPGIEKQIASSTNGDWQDILYLTTKPLFSKMFWIMLGIGIYTCMRKKDTAACCMLFSNMSLAFCLNCEHSEYNETSQKTEMNRFSTTVIRIVCLIALKMLMW